MDDRTPLITYFQPMYRSENTCIMMKGADVQNVLGGMCQNSGGCSLC